MVKMLNRIRNIALAAMIVLSTLLACQTQMLNMQWDDITIEDTHRFYAGKEYKLEGVVINTFENDTHSLANLRLDDGRVYGVFQPLDKGKFEIGKRYSLRATYTDQAMTSAGPILIFIVFDVISVEDSSIPVAVPTSTPVIGTMT